MAKNIILDAFSGYDTATAGIFWNLTAPTIGAAIGRDGRPGASTTGRRSFALESTVCVGVAHKLTSAFGNTPIVRFGNDRSLIWAQLIVTGDARLYVSVGYSLNEHGASATSAPIIAQNQWFYYEFKVTHSAIVGPPNYSRFTYEVRVNEGPVLSGAIDVVDQPSEIGFANVSVYTNVAGATANYCDLFVTDGEFLGDIKNYIIRPDGDSAPSQWTPSAPGDHYLMVDDAAPDGDATTLSSPNSGDQDMVTLEDIALSGIIRGIQANFVGQKTDAGISKFRSEYSWLGTPYENATDKYLSYQAFLNFPDCFRKNPLTGNDFTVAEINSMTMGVKRTG